MHNTKETIRFGLTIEFQDVHLDQLEALDFAGHLATTNDPRSEEQTDETAFSVLDRFVRHRTVIQSITSSCFCSAVKRLRFCLIVRYVYHSVPRGYVTKH